MSNYGFVAMAYFALFPISSVRKDFERVVSHRFQRMFPQEVIAIPKLSLFKRKDRSKE
ncbi:hypothetical protein HMPREF1869_01410 [Bacteroidales bacterium KA00251]|nr:hypothetical protein HMPREF1869_01410 [Bacteroidales bacterium KA00251]